MSSVHFIACSDREALDGDAGPDRAHALSTIVRDLHEKVILRLYEAGLRLKDRAQVISSRHRDTEGRLFGMAEASTAGSEESKGGRASSRQKPSVVELMRELNDKHLARQERGRVAAHRHNEQMARIEEFMERITALRSKVHTPMLHRTHTIIPTL